MHNGYVQDVIRYLQYLIHTDILLKKYSQGSKNCISTDFQFEIMMLELFLFVLP